MISMVSIVLALAVTFNAAIPVGPGNPGNPGKSTGRLNITEKPRLGEFLKIYPGGTIANARNPRLMLNLRFHHEKSPLMNLYQAFGMNPVNFTDPMGTHRLRKLAGPGGMIIEVWQPDFEEIERGVLTLSFSYKLKDKIQTVNVSQHQGEAWAFQAKLGNPILKPLFEYFYGYSTETIKDSTFKLWLKTLSHHKEQIALSALGSYWIMAESNAAKFAKSQNLSKMAHPINKMDDPLVERIIKYNAKAGRFYDAKTGRFIKFKEVPWPENYGFVSYREGMAKPGQIVDRYGSGSGYYLAPEGTPYQMRGIPGGYAEYHKYEVLKPFKWLEGYTAPAAGFNSIGGGYQYMTTKKVKDLISQGYLKEIF